MGNEEQKEFMEYLDKFFKSIEKIAISVLIERSVVYKELEAMLNDIIKNLRSDATRSEISTSVTNAIKNGDNEMMKYLSREIKFFDKLIEVKDIGHRIKLDAAKTIKDSIEEWLGKSLPPIVITWFKILNEILSLI